MSALTRGEKWIRLLRAYGPVADNEAMQAEHVGKLSAYLGVPQLVFRHPARQLILDCFPVSTGSFRNVVLTGTAGEGKTSLCFELVEELTEETCFTMPTNINLWTPSNGSLVEIYQQKGRKIK